jgi:hypothetical protein
LGGVDIPIQIARDSKQVAFHRWLTDSPAGQPRGHKGVRSDFIRNHGITGKKQDKSTNVRRVPFIKVFEEVKGETRVNRVSVRMLAISSLNIWPFS